MDEFMAEFNASVLVFLPKSPIEESLLGSQVYDPSGVRPLSIANTDNRVIASAVRLALEPAVSQG